ncbi:MAG: DUF4157 domain-containing protein [Proteobacteria bacterium]|nr:DUF4157 domain-containing protein [Pseudomonadota bacterium]
MPKRTKEMLPEHRFLLENLFGDDFGRVKIHQDFLARRITRRLKARAVTIGNRIFMAPDEDPGDYPFGFLLMTHELVHVVQYQRQGFLPFLARYFWDLGRGLMAGKRTFEAYRAVPAEKQAFDFEAEIREWARNNPEIGEILNRKDLNAEEKFKLLEDGLTQISNLQI